MSIKYSGQQEQVMQTTKENQHPISYFRIWYVFALAILALNILRGIRFPNMWSYTHFLFNYEFGFTRRGLIGEVVSRFDNAYLTSYDFFIIFSLIIFCINILLISIIVREFIYSQSLIFIGCSIVFSSSLAIVYLSHTIGYFDHIGLLITLVALRINGFYKKTILLLTLIPCIILIHEAFLILFFPIIFMSLIFSIDTEKYIMQLSILAIFSISVCILTSFVSNAILESSETLQMYNSLQSTREYPLRHDAFSILYWDSSQNLNLMKSFWSNMERIKILIFSLFSVAPMFLTLIYLSILILKRSKSNGYIITLSAFASLSPLLLHFFGWDMDRWNALTVVTSFLMLYVIYTARSVDHEIQMPLYILPIFMLILYINGASSIPLFDGYYVKNFPFFEHFNYINDLIQGREAFPYIPLS